MRIRRQLAVLGLSGALGALAFAPAAQGHTTCVFHTYDQACVQSEHVDILACDGERDGNRVRAHYYTQLNPTLQVTGWDPDGAGGLCAHTYTGARITSFRICEEVNGCSAWKNDP